MYLRNILKIVSYLFIITDFIGKEPKKAVLLAAQNNELEILRKLLETDPDLINARDNDLYTPLHRACYSNNVEVIRVSIYILILLICNTLRCCIIY